MQMILIVRSTTQRNGLRWFVVVSKKIQNNRLTLVEEIKKSNPSPPTNCFSKMIILIASKNVRITEYTILDPTEGKVYKEIPTKVIEKVTAKIVLLSIFFDLELDNLKMRRIGII